MHLTPCIFFSATAITDKTKALSSQEFMITIESLQKFRQLFGTFSTSTFLEVCCCSPYILFKHANFTSIVQRSMQERVS